MIRSRCRSLLRTSRWGNGLTINDVAVAPTENSIVAIVNNHDDGLRTITFDSRGLPLTRGVAVVLQSPRRDLQIGQNIAMILMVLMLTLSLWQWRQKPA